MPTAAKRSKSSMSTQHKQALAVGREQGRVVRRYLEALETHRPKRGRKRTPDSIKKQLAGIEQRLKAADALSRLQLVQERMNLRTELGAKTATVDLRRVEDEFVKVARAYGQRKGISYAAWREAGVEASVLKRAGIRRSAG